MKEITNKTKLIALAVIVVVAIIVIVVVTKKVGDTSKDGAQKADSGNVLNETNDELSEFEQLTLDEPSLNEESAIQLFFFNYFLMRKENKMSTEGIDQFFSQYMYSDGITADKAGYLENLIIPHKVDINNAETSNFNIRTIKREGDQAVFAVSFSFSDGKETEEYYGLAETYNADKEDRLGAKVVDVTTFAPLNGTDKEKDNKYIESFKKYAFDYNNDEHIVSYKERLTKDAELLKAYDKTTPGVDRKSELSEDLYKAYSGETINSDVFVVPTVIYNFKDLKDLGKNTNEVAKGSYKDVLEESSEFPTEYDNVGSVTLTKPTCIIRENDMQALVIAKGIAIASSDYVSDMLICNNMETFDGKKVKINGVITQNDALHIVVLSIDDVVEPAKFSDDESDMYYQIKSEYENEKYICSKKIDDKYFYTCNITSGRTIFNADGTVRGIVYRDNEVTTNFYKYMNCDQLKDLVNNLTSAKDKLEYTPVDEYIENIKNN